MIDLHTLQVGDKVRWSDNGREYTVTAVGRNSFLAFHPDHGEVYSRPWGFVEFRKWEKVEPPLIDPEQVWHLNASGHWEPCTSCDVGDQWMVPTVRITAYEVVA